MINADIGHVLFLDIETVSGQGTYEDLSEDMQKLWKLKARSVLRKYDEPITDEEAADSYKDKAGIYAEFGKIVCISIGVVRRDKDKKLKCHLKSFAGADEKEVLADFTKVVENMFAKGKQAFFCGHNIREFDMPYICRRMVIHQMPLPGALQIAGKKPWEVKNQIDTLELWKFGDYKHYTSLKLLAAILGFPSPKDDIDGSEVGRVFWEENDVDRISLYCEKDVLATVQLFNRYKMLPLLEAEQVVHVGREDT